MKLNKIQTNLWFKNEAEEAVEFYISIFNHSKIGRVTYTGKAHEAFGIPAGQVLTIEFELEGQQFVALNGGYHHDFNPSVSFIVNCATQAEVDYYWERLSEGANEEDQACGWLKDKFGVSWQIVPEKIVEWINSPDKEKVERLMQVMFEMKKLDVKKLEEAFYGN